VGQSGRGSHGVAACVRAPELGVAFFRDHHDAEFLLNFRGGDTNFPMRRARVPTCMLHGGSRCNWGRILAEFIPLIRRFETAVSNNLPDREISSNLHISAAPDVLKSV